MQIIYNRYDEILRGECVNVPKLDGHRFQTYAVTNFRGGIGKTTLSFNLAYEMCKRHQTLFLDVCPQQNFSSLLLNDPNKGTERSIHDAFMEKMMGNAWTSNNDSPYYSVRVQDYNEEFRSGKTCYFIPGSSRLFLFPSQFYSRLNEYFASTSGAIDGQNPAGVLLSMLKTIIDCEIEENKAEKVLIDTSPFFAGGTHLAWAAADALIIPVRVDEQSIFSLELTLEMLHNPKSDFNIWLQRTGIAKKPVVQAILMTHCGWNRRASHQIDGASKMYIERAITIANQYSDVFSTDTPIDHFALLSDFLSSGRISGSKAIPIDKLSAGQTHIVDHRKLEVNESVKRYKKELAYAFGLINQ